MLFDEKTSRYEYDEPPVTKIYENKYRMTKLLDPLNDQEPMARSCCFDRAMLLQITELSKLNFTFRLRNQALNRVKDTTITNVSANFGSYKEDIEVGKQYT